VDLALECFSNGRERYLDERKALLAAADKRFVLHWVYVPKESLLGILEVHWDVSVLETLEGVPTKLWVSIISR
jgi:hypothetical protein